MRQRAAERRLESRDHDHVLLAQKSADEGRRVGIGASQQAQKILAAALRIARKLQRGDEHRGKNPLAGKRTRGGLAFESSQQRDTLLVHRIESPREHGLKQVFLASEMVVHRGKVDGRGRSDLAQRRRLEAVLHEQFFGAIEDFFLGCDGASPRIERDDFSCHEPVPPAPKCRARTKIT